MKVNIRKNEDNQQSEIWDISSILSNIFEYMNHKDLVEFNTVCKKWNHIIGPIIHKTIKLYRKRDIIEQVYDKKMNSVAKIDADVVECISNNAKYAHLVKELHYMHKLEPRRAIEVFGTFRFISNLTISNIEMSQDQFLGMINPLKQLQELTLRNLTIKRIIYKRLYKEVVQLPQNLKKLRMGTIRLINNPELFIDTINSHGSLIEFSYLSSYNSELLKPFYKYYSSLSNFEYYNNEQDAAQLLLAIFENNPQLISLKLSLKCCNRKLISHISSYLIDLEELKLFKIGGYLNGYTDFIVGFSQPTKIKKLILDWTELSNCSLNSILLNCPYLEELYLNRFVIYKRHNYIKFLNLSNSVKLKKLAIDCDSLSEGALHSLLLNCPSLSELDIILSCEWKEAMKSIYENCDNLEKIDICLSDQIYLQNLNDAFKREFYKTEFFTSNSKCKFTLTHLTLKGLKVVSSNAEYFESFKKLRSIKYLNQFIINYNSFNKEAEIDMNLWPGYRLLIVNINISYSAELKKIL